MLTPIAPWLNPPDFLGYMRGGASLGLDSAKLAQQGEIAAQQLLAERERAAAQTSLGYAENATRAQENQARLAQLEADKQLSQQDRLAQLGIAKGHLDVSQAHQNLLESNAEEAKKKSALGRYYHVGDALLHEAPDGTITTTYNGPSKLDPIDSKKYDLASRRYMAALKALQQNPDQADQWNPELESAKAEMKAIEAKHGGPSLAAPTGTPDSTLFTPSPGPSIPENWWESGASPAAGAAPLAPVPGLSAPQQPQKRFRYNPATGGIDPV